MDEYVSPQPKEQKYFSTCKKNRHVIVAMLTLEKKLDKGVQDSFGRASLPGV